MEITKDILALRPYLFGIAYNMLAVIEEAEDIVHDVYEKWMSVNDVTHPKAYLGRMVMNSSIDRLNKIKTERADYKGYWLPEPYISMEPEGLPTVEYGLLRLMERLNPMERAVFILRESFSEEYSLISEITGLSPDNCRQSLHRAHEKLGRSHMHAVDTTRQKSLTEAFLYALESEDLQTLTRLLREDIELYNDGGGKRAAALRPLFGLQKVLKFLGGVVQLPETKEHKLEYRPAYVNGHPAALLFRSNGELDSVQYVELDDKGITRLLYVRNPDKLKMQK